MLERLFPLTETSVAALNGVAATAADPLKTIAERILHINGLFFKKKTLDDKINTLRDKINGLSTQSGTIYKDIRKKVAIVASDAHAAGLDERMTASIISTNWEFLASETAVPKADIVVWYIKKHFAGSNKLSKHDINGITQMIGIDVKSVIKTLKDRHILVLKKKYTCPECGNAMSPNDLECDECGEEFDSKSDLEHEVWYEKGENFYPQAQLSQPAETVPDDAQQGNEKPEAGSFVDLDVPGPHPHYE